jgi:flagellar biosynthesis/type III secretory pathway chaperone
MRNMDQRGLLSIMDRHISLHRELIELEREKISRILAQDWSGLEEQVKRSTEILHRIETTEQRRVKILQAQGRGADATLAEIVEILSTEGGKELQLRGQTMRSLLTELRDLNHRCEELISSSLEVVDFTLSLLAGRGTGGKTYSGEGSEQADRDDHPSLVFDVKA